MAPTQNQNHIFMSYIHTNNTKIKGVTVCVPKNTVENRLYEVVPEEKREQFVESIGIERRRVAPDNVCTSDLCAIAAEHLLERIGWSKDEIELIVFVTQTPDYRMPATSCILQERLALPKTCMAIDVSQGCSGYVYGLGITSSLLSIGTLKKGLLLVGNTQSKNINYRDKSAYPLFSDAGSATAIEFSPENGDDLLLSYMTDGSGKETIIIPEGGYRNMATPQSFEEKEYEGGIVRNNLNIFMHGDDVFSFVISNVPRATQRLFEQFSIDKEVIDYWLIHHASKFVCRKLIKKLGIPEEKVPLLLRDFGNSSNATIPLLMTYLSSDICSRKLNLYVSGFGVGMSMGVGVINVGEFMCADMIEY